MNQGTAPVARDGAAAPAGDASVASSAAVVLYDGVCGLCNRYVQFLLARDRHRRFQFAPLQGPFAARALARHGLVAPDVPDSIVLLEAAGTPAERARLRSDAVLAIVAQLGGPWRLVTALRVIPAIVRDAVYAVVARWRYRLFGRFDSCAVPPPGARDRFLE